MARRSIRAEGRPLLCPSHPPTDIDIDKDDYDFDGAATTTSKYGRDGKGSDDQLAGHIDATCSHSSRLTVTACCLIHCAPARPPPTQATDSPFADDMDDGRLRLGLRHRQATRGTRVGFTFAGSECATQQALAIRWERAALHDVKSAPPAPVLAFRRRDTTSLRDVLRPRRATPVTTPTATWGVRAGPYPAASDCATHQALAIRWERATLRALGSDAFRVGLHALKA
ncbi:hypothetical protein EV714DRAFT_277547 [Schizophyllum commune]